VPPFALVLSWIRCQGLFVPDLPLDLADKHTVAIESPEPSASRRLGFTRVPAS